MEIDEDFSGVLRWRAFAPQFSPEVEKSPETSVGAHGIAVGLKYRVSSPYIKCEAGVGQSIFEGLFRDTSTNLVYSNARYLNPAQGQFLTEDPVFWGQQNLQNPQSFNAYSYAENNPIIKSDPSGKFGEFNANLTVDPVSIDLTIDFDSNNIYFRPAVGVAAGLKGSYRYSGTYAPGDYVDSKKTSIEAGGDGILGAGININANSTFESQSNNFGRPTLQATPELGLGADLYARARTTLFVMPSGYKCGNYCPPLTAGSSDSTPNYAQSAQSFFSNFQSSFSPSTNSTGASINRTSSQYIIPGAGYTSSGQIATYRGNGAKHTLD